MIARLSPPPHPSCSCYKPLRRLYLTLHTSRLSVIALAGSHPKKTINTMAWRSHGTSNETLVQQLWRNGLIKDERVRDAFLKVDRGHYAPRNPYADAPQSIGHAATISAPHMHATAVEHLVNATVPVASEDGASPSPPGRRVLDVGCGSGYLTHVFAELVGERGMVVGVEHIPQLRDLAESNMRKSAEGRAFLDSGRVHFRVGDGRKGWVENEDGDNNGVDGTWDVIHVGASAATLHPELVAQLRAPGRMFIPVNDVEDEAGAGRGVGGDQSVWVVDKDAEGRVEKRRLFAVRYVPLTDGPGL